MASYKSLTVFLFAAMLIILLVFCGTGEARDLKDSDDVTESEKIESLGYGAITKDRIPSCSSKNPKECVKQPANHYSRGCEISTRCHRPPMLHV
ncbi:hypothetical protein EUTSA_v10003039mg [Eutrema salsugineum]|uniref:Rapid alkalinization factor 1 n=1 Tax=Eutrema salsugineum TaxID=72664 RepID=V4KHV0_EUTSA|nr:hypothetical protein EUTSA_v10003039mg [Eutrema salsugineum]